jgi:hypothetical protein
LLFVFHGLVQFSDAKLQPFYFSTGIVFEEHLPVLSFTENTNLYTADKDGGIHNLELGLAGLEEFDATKDSPSYKRQGVCGVNNEAGEHFSAVELPYHR